MRCDACPVLCHIRPGRAGACDRYGNEDGKLVRVDPLVLLAKPDLARVAFVEGSEAWRGELGKGEGAFVTGIGAGTTYPDYKPAPFIVVVEARRRRHGHRRDRGHLQLLRRQGEDRHRPLPRPRAGGGARQGRGGRPRHHGRIRLADAVARRRASPDRRQQEGGRRHLRGAAGALQQASRSSSRSTAARPSWCRPTGRRSSTARARSACASAAARPPSACSRSSGRAMSTR